METFDLNKFIYTDEYKKIEKDLINLEYKSILIHSKNQEEIIKLTVNDKISDKDKEELLKLKADGDIKIALSLSKYEEDIKIKTKLLEDFSLLIGHPLNFKIAQALGKDYKEGVAKSYFIEETNEKILSMIHKFLKLFGVYSKYIINFITFVLFFTLFCFFISNPIISTYIITGFIFFLLVSIAISILIGVFIGITESTGLFKALLFGGGMLVAYIFFIIKSMINGKLKNSFIDAFNSIKNSYHYFGKYLAITFGIIAIIFFIKTVIEIYKRTKRFIYRDKTYKEATEIINEIQIEEDLLKNYILQRIVASYAKYCTIIFCKYPMQAERKYNTLVGRNFIDNFLINYDMLQEELLTYDEENYLDYLDFYINLYNEYTSSPLRLANFYDKDKSFDFNKALKIWKKFKTNDNKYV